jgi:single-stranded DNA-binding protein
MAVASLVVVVDAQPKPVLVNERECLELSGVVAGASPVAVKVRCSTTGSVSTALSGATIGAPALVSGEISLDPEGSTPIIMTNTYCPASVEQYLNSVLLCGHIGGEPRFAESGKSVRRSIALNRYHRPAEGGDFIEQTDWFHIRAFGFLKDKLSNFPTGGLLEVSGSFEQMTSSSGDHYAEIKCRSLRLHKGKRAAANPAKGTAAVGYEQSDFEGSPDDIPASGWGNPNSNQ